MLEIRRYQDQDYDAVCNLHIVTIQQVGADRGEGTWDDDLRQCKCESLSNAGVKSVNSEKLSVVRCIGN